MVGNIGYSVDTQPYRVPAQGANPINPIDTLLISTLGFIVVERSVADASIDVRLNYSSLLLNPTPTQQDVVDWNIPSGMIPFLQGALPGGKAAGYAQQVLMNQWSGRPL